MRTKEEILRIVSQDITTERYKETAHLWIEHRKIEVLIDIRDELTTIKIAALALNEHLQALS